MKKISIFSTLLAGVVALAACTQIEDTPVPDPIGYGQEDKVGEMTITATTLQAVAAPIDLAEAGETIDVMTVNVNENVPADARLENLLVISPSESFTDSLTTKLSTICEADSLNPGTFTVRVKTNEFDRAIKSVCGYEEQTFAVYVKLETIVIDKDNHRIIIKSQATQTAAITTTPNLKEFFVVGDFSGWNQTNGQRLYSFNSAPAQGWIVLNGQGGNGWKISSQADWNGTNYGAGEEGELEAAQLLLSTDGGAPNITQYEGFCYQFEFDPVELKLTVLNTVSQWGIIGSFNSWGDDLLMTLSEEDGMDYLYAEAQFAANDEFKFRANAGWDINYGANAGETALEMNGGNIAVAEEGTYEVRFYFCAEVPYYELIKK